MANAEQTLLDFYKANSPVVPFKWLQGRTFSEAFVICIGAGPWKFGRRKKIQGEVLDRLQGKDLVDLDLNEVSEFYPLAWQNNFLENTVRFLQQTRKEFEQHCSFITSFYTKQEIDGIKTNLLYYPLSEVHAMTQCSGNPKVLSLFCRDGLKLPSFPIDRHVKRKLIELGLPTNERRMMHLCTKAGIDPREVAVAFVRAASNMDNPDWSI